MCPCRCLGTHGYCRLRAETRNRLSQSVSQPGDLDAASPGTGLRQQTHVFFEALLPNGGAQRIRCVTSPIALVTFGVPPDVRHAQVSEFSGRARTASLVHKTVRERVEQAVSTSDSAVVFQGNPEWEIPLLSLDRRLTSFGVSEAFAQGKSQQIIPCASRIITYYLLPAGLMVRHTRSKRRATRASSSNFLSTARS